MVSVSTKSDIHMHQLLCNTLFRSVHFLLATTLTDTVSLLLIAHQFFAISRVAINCWLPIKQSKYSSSSRFCFAIVWSKLTGLTDTHCSKDNCTKHPAKI